jgi:hypothetical protein
MTRASAMPSGAMLRCARRVGAMDCSTAPLTQPDVRASHPALWLVHQRASDSWSDACEGLSSDQRVDNETNRPANQDGG